MDKPAEQSIPSSDESPAPVSPADALGHIVDDFEPLQGAKNWVAAELMRGRDGDELLAELVSNGWSHDQAEEIVGDMRRQTRADRGIVTRESVVANADQKFRRSFHALSFLGFGIAFWSMIKLIYSLADFRQLSRQSRGMPANDPTTKQTPPTGAVRLFRIWPRLLLWLLFAIACYLYLSGRW